MERVVVVVVAVMCVCAGGDSMGTLEEEQRAERVTWSEASSFFCAPHGHKHLRHSAWTELHAAGGQYTASVVFCVCVV